MSKSLHQLTTNVKLLQKVALVHEGKVLLLKRGDDAPSRPSCWDLPGGNSEWPKAHQVGLGQLRKDAIREVKEETTLQLSEVDFTVDRVVFLDTFFDGKTYAMMVGWSIRLASAQKIELSQEHTDFFWAAKEDVSSYDFGLNKGEWVRDIATKALNF